MSLHLISFKTCPFVQRAVITLKHKNIDFDITYIDLAEPPDWFLEMSPLGKVPVLKVDDEILFESAVINEYLDEITGGELQPKDPLARAKNRAWIEFASNMLGNLYMMKMSKDEEHFDKYRELLVSQLHRVEERLGEGPWFNGAEFSLADTAFAPLFRQNSVAGGKLSVLDADTMAGPAGGTRFGGRRIRGFVSIGDAKEWFLQPRSTGGLAGIDIESYTCKRNPMKILCE
jgi:glutathione S-transferase